MNKDPRQEVDEELRFHLEQRTRYYITRGLSPEAAREAAARRFGDAARVSEACTAVLLAQHAAEQRRTFVKMSWLDVKLGLRMLAKYPGLSLVAVAGMAIAIAFGAGYFALVGSFLDSRVPIERGDRVAMIRHRYVPGIDAAGAERIGDVGPAAFDFRHWQDRVTSVVELSALRDDKRNLITEDGHVQLVRVAAITASGLRLTRVAPLLGRALLDEDERAGAPPVLVIAYELWQRQFDGDARVLGRTVRLGDTPHTIVGVMPEGFAFPILHRGWVPLRLSGLDADPGGGPPLIVFGRLGEGYSLSQARAELTALGDGMAAAFPQSHRTALIVVQVALAVTALPGTIFKAAGLLRMGTIAPAEAAAGLLRGTLHMPGDSGTTPDARFAERMTTLIQRMQEQPEVAAVTFADAIPGAEGQGVIESEGPFPLIPSRVNFVATNLFDVFDVRLLEGRGFTDADAHPTSSAVIVDQAFAERLAPGGRVVGRRIRFAAPDGASEPNPWMEIVGVMPVFSSSFTPAAAFGPPTPSLYRAVTPGGSHPVTLVVKVRKGDPARYRQKLQELTASVDPTMEVEVVAGVAELWEREQKGMRMVALIVVAVNASVLLLSAAGIHAMMSFTVTRRWREIGIRVALGADARRVLMGIFGRASAQIGGGVAAGLTLAAILEWAIPGGNVGGKALFLFPAVAAVMLTVGLLAAAGPARRGLAVEPTEALRTE